MHLWDISLSNAFIQSLVFEYKAIEICIIQHVCLCYVSENAKHEHSAKKMKDYTVFLHSLLCDAIAWGIEQSCRMKYMEIIYEDDREQKDTHHGL